MTSAIVGGIATNVTPDVLPDAPPWWSGALPGRSRGTEPALKAGAEQSASCGYTTVQEGRALPPVVDATVTRNGSPGHHTLSVNR
jgi:hypothetical protein